jgi:hypothetical protein
MSFVLTWLPALDLDCGSGPTRIAVTSEGERWTKSVAVDHDLVYR